MFGFCNGSGHACLWWRNPSCAYFSACWPGFLRVSRGNCFFCNLLGTMVFLFHADAFPSEQFFRIFSRQTTKNGSKGAFSVLSPFVVFVLFLSSSLLVLRWLWPRMLVVPKPKLFVFLGLLAWFAVSVTLRCFFCSCQNLRGSWGGRSASPRKENNQLQLTRPPQAGERQGGALGAPGGGASRGGALGAEEGKAGAGLG